MELNFMRQKSFWPPLVLNLFLWGGWLYLVIQYPPDNLSLLVLFFLLLFLALSFTISLILGSRIQGFILSAALIIFLIFRFLKMDNILNLIILFSLLLTIELYLRRDRRSPPKNFPQG